MTQQELHQKIAELLKQEKENNPVTYAGPISGSELPYQAYDRIGLEGLRWTPEKRIAAYGIDKVIKRGDAVLDIGCNMGFMGIELACVYDAEVLGLEPNPYLCKVGELVADYLELKKVSFMDAKFENLDKLDLKFDLILSLAVFHTSDKRESEDPRPYVDRCVNLLNPGGRLVFESVSYPQGERQDYLAEAVQIMEEKFDGSSRIGIQSGKHVRDYFVGVRK